MQEVILFYNGLDVQTRQILDSKGAIPSKTTADAKLAIQEMAEYSQKWHNGTSKTRSAGTSDGLAAIQAQLNNLGREIKKVNEKVYAATSRCDHRIGPTTQEMPTIKEEVKPTMKLTTHNEWTYQFEVGKDSTTLGFNRVTMQIPFHNKNEGHLLKNPEQVIEKNQAKRHEENYNMIKEIRALTVAAVQNQGASIKTLEIQIGQIRKV
ncbi:hypothetical protein Tco_0842731 [Tanacetum coccineum]|uniref:Uncharacterized protein n=1 Tax=Tanacetum coccineum TaxID=301880 RepID=A0ABQ5B1U1_9ASTR